MRRHSTCSRSVAFCLAVAGVVGLAPLAIAQEIPQPQVQPQPPAADLVGQDTEWPRSFEDDGAKLTIYQPQLEKWDNVKLIARAAVSIETKVSPTPAYGVIWIDARADVDKESRTVTLEDIKLRGSFPTAPEKTDAWLGAIKRNFPEMKRVSLDRLEASLAVLKAELRAEHSVQVKNEPPQIVFSSRPAILVLVDGKPVMRRAGPALLRVINTRSLVLQDERSGHYFLAVGDGWCEAPRLEGPWALASSVPSNALQVRSEAAANKGLELYTQDQEIVTLVAQGQVPAVYTATSPMEIIETNGAPEYAAIPGTRLYSVTNTDASVFYDNASRDNFVLISGRWFRSKSLEGPWLFVPGRQLPPDFSKIPEDVPAGEVLASVPGTPQAAEAAIENEIPQTATVKRNEARLEVTYDGDPQFQGISGSRMSYAINTQTPVILLDGRYYACQDGIWFTAPSAEGPWEVADAIPPEIYSMPASSPVHYVTYVHIYDATPDSIYYGYTPGYYGTCIADDGCIVWGTGWWYRPWCGRVWLGHPWTYGFGCGVRWNVGFGWSLGFGIGCRPACRPWWGPLGSPRFGFFAPVAWTGAAFHTNIVNANIYGRWGAGVVPRGGFERGDWHGRFGGRNNVFASPDGRVFRNENGAWEHHDNGGWRRNGEAERRANQLDNERRVRERGFERQQNFQRPLQPQREAPQQHQAPQQHFAPHSSSPGLRGGTVRGGGGGHGGGGHGGGGGHR